MPQQTYADAILAQVPRVVSLMDRDPISSKLGCCDRVHWAWKFVDFPGARFQEALCVLSFVYATPISGSHYHHSSKLLTWIGHGLRFWSSIQYGDGSFDEAYPYERSLAATAFTTFYVSEALGFLGDALPRDIRTKVIASIEKAAYWLCRNDETHGFLSNHLAAAAAALYHAALLTGKAEFKERSAYFLNRIFSHQSAEGWYDEYGGADPGYQTHGSFYMARLWQLSQNEELFESLQRAIIFQAHFIHPDGSLGGEYASRNTQTYYPAAFEMMAPHQDAAAWIAEAMRPTIFAGAAVGLPAIDAYNFFPILNNLVFAYLAYREAVPRQGEADQPGAAEQLLWFPAAGIARLRYPRYEAVVGTAKGGVLKIFDRQDQTLLLNDCGYYGQLRNGRVIAMQYLDHERHVRVQPDQIEVNGAFFAVSRPVMEPFRFVAFRLFSLSVGRLPALAHWLKRYLVKVLIYRKRPLDIRFKRIIRFGETAVTIQDEIVGPAGKDIAFMRWGERFATVHMGSSRYFIRNELQEPATSAAGDFSADQVVAGIKLERVVQVPAAS